MIEKRLSMVKALGAGYNRFYHNRQFYRVVKGSRGSKKSKTAALCYIHDLLKYPWANLLVVRKFSNTNKQSTYTDLKWAANRLGVYDKFKFNESMPEITVKRTGQKILFRGMDDPLKITSISVDVGILCWAWFEEAYQLDSMDAFDTTVESIRGSYDSPDFYKQITLTFNPWSENHWLKREFFDEETRRKDVFSMTTTFRLNEWLDEQDRKRYTDLYRTNPRRAKIVCDGDWGVAEGLVYENVEFRPIDDEEIDMKHFKLLIGLDFGFKHDPTALIVSWLDEENNRIYVVDEHYEQGMTTSEIAAMIRRKGYGKSTIIADCAEGRLIYELKREHDIQRIRESRKGKDSVNSGISKLQDYRIICGDTCVNAKEEFYSYAYKKDKVSGKYTNQPEDKDNHLMDALRYSLQCVETGKLKTISKKALGL